MSEGLAHDTPRGLEWRIRPVIRMQNWPLLCTFVERCDLEEVDFVSFRIVGTDAAEIIAMAEKVKAKLEAV